MSAALKFTPGTWVRRRSGIWQYDPATDVVGKEIARVIFPVTTKEQAADSTEAFANCNLICEAPVMLAMLIEFGVINRRHGYEFDANEPDLFARMEATVAKALSAQP
jgi:hypothetical protein